MQRKHLLLLFLFIIGFVYANSQTANVQLRVITSKNAPVPFATVIAISTADSNNKIEKISDSSGLVSFELQQGRPYRIRISSISFKPFEKTIIIKNSSEVFSFLLQPLSNRLNTVVVTATKPFTRQEDDKTIVDPEPIAAASTNAYEILEKTPGVFVDGDGNIYLSSLSPARIYINGREMKMSTADIATMLKNLPPNAISRIEILRTPSAKYDASGGGGIVNIILRKGVKLGLSGSVVAGFQQGE